MLRKTETPHLGALLILLAAKALLISWLILAGPIGLGPDEAQYWTWSQKLQFGYYSKPPGIAWQIKLGTLLFGNSELGVRALSLLFGFLLPLAVYLLGRICRLSSAAAFWAALITAITPLGLLGSLFAITDGGLALFWTLSLAVIAYGLAREERPHYYLLALFVVAGALFKWPIYLIWCLLLGLLPFFPFLRSRHLPIALLLSFLGLLPSILWNLENGGVTFLHVFHSLKGAEPAQGNFFSFLGAQVALVSPLFFALLIWGWGALAKQREKMEPPLLFCALSSLFLFGFFACFSLFKKVQGNWPDFLYPGAFVFLAWYHSDRNFFSRLLLILGAALSLLICSFIVAIPAIQSRGLFPEWQIPYKMNPFRHNIGWKRLEKTLTEAGYTPEKDFLFGDKYQTTSILSFYSEGQKRAYFLNLFGRRLNQFSFWPSMADEQKGKSGFFVATENAPHLENFRKLVPEYQAVLEEYFSKVEFLGERSLFTSYGKPAKIALLFKCEDYNGKKPEISNKF